MTLIDVVNLVNLAMITAAQYRCVGQKELYISLPEVVNERGSENEVVVCTSAVPKSGSKSEVHNVPLANISEKMELYNNN
jgi:hypothetical protein